MRLSALGFVLACAFASVAATGARAQDGQHGQGHAENHDWYKDLKQPQTGYSCCNGRTGTTDGDCRPTRAYLNDDGMWYALLDGKWVPVPPRVVLEAAGARRLLAYLRQQERHDLLLPGRLTQNLAPRRPQVGGAGGSGCHQPREPARATCTRIKPVPESSTP